MTKGLNAHILASILVLGGIILAQISLYVNDSMAEQLGLAAKEHECSVSSYVASIVSEKLSQEKEAENKKKAMLEQLCGALGKKDFEKIPDLPRESGIKRRYDLI